MQDVLNHFERQESLKSNVDFPVTSLTCLLLRVNFQSDSTKKCRPSCPMITHS